MPEDSLHVKILEQLLPSLLETSIECFLREANISGNNVFRLDYSVIRRDPTISVSRDTYACIILYKK